MGHVVEPTCSLTFQVDEVSTFHDVLEGKERQYILLYLTCRYLPT